jgi:hypothetical protein
MLRGIADNAFLAKWAGGLGGSLDGGARHRRLHRRHQRRVAGRHPLPQAPQRPARGGQPGRQTQGLRLRVSGNLAQRHLRVPRAAQEHRRRSPPHARHEHGELDSRPVHEAHGGPQHWTLFRSNEVRDLHELYGAAFESATSSTSARGGGQNHGQKIEALELWKKMLSMLFETGHPWITFKDACNHPLPAGSRRRHSLVEPLHRDHPQHEQRRDGGLQPRLGDSRDPPEARRLARPCEAARHDPHGRARPRQRHRHQLLPDGRGQDVQPAPPPDWTRRDGARPRPLPARPCLRLPRSGRVQRRSDGGHRVLRLRGELRPRRRTRCLLDLQGVEVGPRTAAAGHAGPARAGARGAGRGTAGRTHGLGARAREDRAAGDAQLELPRDRARPRRSRTSPPPRPASSRPTRTSSSNRTSRASSSS